MTVSVSVRRRVARSRKTIVIGLLSLVYIGAVLYIVDLGDLVSVLGRISGVALAAAASLIVLANLFALARAGAVLKALGFWPGLRDLFLAFSASNVANLPLNVVGQSLTRAMVLVRAGIPFGVTVMATYIERILAAGLLFLFSLVGLWYLFGDIDLELYGGAGDILATIAGIAIVGSAVGLILLRRRLLRSGAAYMHWLRKLWPGAVLTILAHGAGLGAYLVLLTDFVPYGASAGMAAAVVIVMLVTALPISFAGWGLRELSAASALGLIGIAPEIAIAAALAIGLLYLAATGLFAVLGVPLLTVRRRGAAPAGAGEDRVTMQGGGTALRQDWDARIVYGCAISCAILLFFRVPTQFGTGDAPINVSVSDVIVFVALGVIVLMIAAGRMRSLFPSFLTVTLASLSAVIGIGLVASWAQDNLGSWALYTRGVGWILMLGYAALGAATVGIAGENGRRLVLRSLIVAAVTICILQLLALAWSAFVSPVPRYVLAYPLQGFAGNQNAFSFELAMIGTLLIAGRALGLFEARQWLFAAAVSVLALTIFLTGSRTGVVFVVVLALLDRLCAARIAGNRSGPKSAATLLAAIAIVSAVVLPSMVRVATPVLASAFGIETDADAPLAPLAQANEELHSIYVEPDQTRLLHPSADLERWDTIVGGLRLWRESPLLGAGLGAYVESVLASGAPAHGIHSIYVWFLAEMGILGLGVVTGLGVLIAVKGWRMTVMPSGQAAAAPWGFAIVGILSLMAIGGLVQDFFFQRMFWFLLGLAAAVAGGAVKDVSDPRIFLAVVVAFGLLVFSLAL